jgi:hypothetical protein
MSSTPTSTSTTSTSTAPAIPEAARANNSEGALAFTRFFLAEVNRGYNSMSAESIKTLSASNCQACAIMRDSIQQWKQQGKHYVGDFITPTVVTISAFPNDLTAKVLVSSKTAESKLLDARNSVDQTFAAEEASTVVALMYQDGQWRVAEIKAAG